MDEGHGMYGHEHCRCAFSDEVDRIDELVRRAGQGAWTSRDPGAPRSRRRKPGVAAERHLERALVRRSPRRLTHDVRAALAETLPKVRTRVSLRKGILLVRVLEAGRGVARSVENILMRIAAGTGVIVDVRWGDAARG